MIEMLAAIALLGMQEGSISSNEFPPIKFLQGYEPFKSTAGGQYTRHYKINLEVARKGIEKQFGPGYAYREGGYGWGFGDIHNHAGRTKYLFDWARKTHPRRWLGYRPAMTINVLPLTEGTGYAYRVVPGMASVGVQVQWGRYWKGTVAKAAYLRLSNGATFFSGPRAMYLNPDGRADGAMHGTSHFPGVWKAAGTPAKRGKPAKVTKIYIHLENGVELHGVVSGSPRSMDQVREFVTTIGNKRLVWKRP